MSGEVSFIPYLTAVVLYPTSGTVALVGIAGTITELLKRRHLVKKLFNVAQFVLATSAATLAYLALGGQSLLVDSSFQLLPHAASVLTFLVVNAAAVAAVIAIAEKRRFIPDFWANQKASFVYDVFAIPGVYGVARAFTDWSYFGLAITVALLYGVRLTYQAKHQLEKNNRELLDLFVRATEYGDKYTKGHSERVSHYSRLIASSLGLSPAEVNRVGRAALLHDVGKIHEIFRPIITKPGKLTPEEWAIMELHPIKSEELVSMLSDFRDVLPDVRHHHERFDGRGYPDRLAGREIPIGARIIAIADTIDAMTTDRPYRKAMGIDEVRVELLRCRGSQFDPDLIERFVASSQFEDIFKSFEPTAWASGSVTGGFALFSRGAKSAGRKMPPPVPRPEALTAVGLDSSEARRVSDV